MTDKKEKLSDKKEALRKEWDKFVNANSILDLRHQARINRKVFDFFWKQIEEREAAFEVAYSDAVDRMVKAQEGETHAAYIAVELRAQLSHQEELLKAAEEVITGYNELSDAEILHPNDEFLLGKCNVRLTKALEKYQALKNIKVIPNV